MRAAANSFLSSIINLLLLTVIFSGLWNAKNCEDASLNFLENKVKSTNCFVRPPVQILTFKKRSWNCQMSDSLLEKCLKWFINHQNSWRLIIFQICEWISWLSTLRFQIILTFLVTQTSWKCSFSSRKKNRESEINWNPIVKEKKWHRDRINLAQKCSITKRK